MTDLRPTQLPVRPPPTVVRTGGYGDLARQIRAHDLLRPRPWSYAGYAAIILVALGATVAVMATHRDSWWLLALTPAMAVIATQTGFLGHDVGHLQVTRNAGRSRLLGLVIANLFSGLSYGWWVRKHNAHHAHPNDLETDPDVRGGVLIWDTSQGTSRRGVAAWWTRQQALLFFPLLVFEAMNLHLASVRALFAPGLRLRAVEATLLVTHFAAYILLLALTMTWPQAVLFVMIHKGLQGIYLGCSFAPNHKGMPILQGAEADDPLLRQVLTSRNVRGGPVTDAALGGLNYQIEHHLFPSMPRANLRHAQPLVREFCAEREIPYLECSAVASYTAALKHMHRVGAGKASGDS
ncbi:delta fatty acid desaturase [Flexivirga endophytica]|uniref:Delta fatty acid desaturase n=1 Tax=Flexivirga endophytica TaxID=1849103 RepID=A0A916SW45_9MICO|nr:acyl-CoA desaturase [Flexivirga endophytica]GGB19041.1 delta fatty acid desaturase [Flexivirga endophytica]GHB36611.1 delta fatty acid desaturase [Flexivirga endophytica]